MNRPSFDEVWLSIANTIALRSRCSRARVGAVIVDINQRIVSTGYNGPAAGYPDMSETCMTFCERAKSSITTAYNNCPSIHAEMNALIYSDRSKIEGGTIYSSVFPCMDCAKAISNSGIVKVVSVIKDSDAHRNPEIVLDYLAKCGISIETIKDDNGWIRRDSTPPSR
jgi:dCMP deaminase